MLVPLKFECLSLLKLPFFFLPKASNVESWGLLRVMERLKLGLKFPACHLPLIPHHATQLAPVAPGPYLPAYLRCVPFAYPTMSQMGICPWTGAWFFSGLLIVVEKVG
jgi:hypothetical protein